MSYETQAATAVYTEAQKKFWDDQALTIADWFECIYDDMIDDMTVTFVTVKEYSGYDYRKESGYYLDEEKSYLVAAIDIRYDFIKDGLIYSYESWTEADFNGDMCADLDDLRKRAKLVSVLPVSAVASHIIPQSTTELSLTA